MTPASWPTPSRSHVGGRPFDPTSQSDTSDRRGPPGSGPWPGRRLAREAGAQAHSEGHTPGRRGQVACAVMDEALAVGTKDCRLEPSQTEVHHRPKFACPRASPCPRKVVVPRDSRHLVRMPTQRHVAASSGREPLGQIREAFEHASV